MPLTEKPAAAMEGSISPFARGNVGQLLCQLGACVCEAHRLRLTTLFHMHRVRVCHGSSAGPMGVANRKCDSADAKAFIHRAFDIEETDDGFDKSVFYACSTEYKPIVKTKVFQRFRVRGSFENSRWFAGAAGAALHAQLRPHVTLAEASERDRLGAMAFVHIPASFSLQRDMVYYTRAVAHMRSNLPGVRFEIFTDDLFNRDVHTLCEMCMLSESIGCTFSRMWKQTDVLCHMAACGVGGIVSTDWLSWWSAFLSCSSTALFTVPSHPYRIDDDQFRRDAHFMLLPNQKSVSIPIW